MNNFQEVEQAVLGYLFVNDNLVKSIHLLSADDFTAENHKTIFSALLKVYEQYGCIDSPLITKELNDIDLCKELVACSEKTIAPSLFDDYVEMLKRQAQKRRLAKSVDKLVWLDNCTIDELQKVIDEEEKFGEVAGAERKADVNYDNYLIELEHPKQLIETGFGIIDSQIKGLEKGTLFIIGARPSTGKTSFALNIANNQVKRGRKTVFFSLEMSAGMIYDRMIANRLSMNYSDVSQRNLDGYAKDRIVKEITELKNDKLFSVIDDTYNVENICSQIIELKPVLAVVDFIQIVSSLQNYRDLREKINYISAELKRVAKKTGCIVLVLSQVTRQGKDAPTMSDLRESGALEQDGDYIVMLHRPYVLNKNIEDETETEVLFDKNKFGWTGSMKTYFDVHHQRFTGFSDRDIGDLPFN